MSASRWIILVCLIAFMAGWWAVDVRGRSKWRPQKPQIHRTDLTVFTGAGRAFVDGDPATDPYDTPNLRGWYYNYPPLLAITLSPLSWLHPQVSSGVWFAVSFACWVGCWHLSRDILRYALPVEGENTQRWIAGVALAAVVLPGLNCLQRGQVGLLLTWLTLWALRALMQSAGLKPSREVFPGGRRAGFPTMLLSLAAVIKLFPALPLLVLLAQPVIAGRWRLAGVMLVSAALALLTFLVLIPGGVLSVISGGGFDDNLHHLHTWLHQVVLNPDLAIDTGFDLRSIRNQSMENGLLLLVSTLGLINVPLPDRAMMTQPAWIAARAVLCLVLLTACVRLALRRDILASATAVALGCTATLVLSPLSWGHYFVMQWPALLLVTAYLLAGGHLRAAWWMLWSGAALLWVHYFALPWAGAWGVMGVGTAAWWVAACAACAWGCGHRDGNGVQESGTLRVAG